MKTNKKTWATLSQNIVHKNPWFHISHEEFVMPNKNIGNYYVINTHGTNTSVYIVPVKDNHIIFVEQYKYVAKGWSLELPAGGQKKSDSTLCAAKKELEEEAGYKARKWKKIATCYPWNGLSAERCVIFLATDVVKTEQHLEDTEQGLHVKEIPIARAYQMLDDGQFTDGQTITALARKYIYH